ncbi:MAG: flagellar hook-associated protein FlgL [bacterium]
MRVSQKLLMESTYSQLNRAGEGLLKLLQQASTGKRVLNASDDPISALRIMEMKNELSRIDPAKRKIEYVKSWLSLSESALQNMEEVLVRAKEIALSQGSATANSQTRASAAVEVRQLYDHILALANTRLGDRYIFGGTQTLVVPVERDDDYQASFNGNQESIQVDVGLGRTVAMNVEITGVLRDNQVLETLRGLITALESNDAQAVTQSLDGLEQGHDALLALRGEVGSRIRSIESNAENLSDLELNLQGTLSDYQDADMAKLLTDLANQQTAYEAALRTTAMITRLSLIEFLS